MPQKGSDLQQENSRGMVVRQRLASILRWAFARMGFFARAALLGNSFGSEFGTCPYAPKGSTQHLANSGRAPEGGQESGALFEKHFRKASEKLS